jgi:hypothetical protein
VSFEFSRAPIVPIALAVLAFAAIGCGSGAAGELVAAQRSSHDGVEAKIPPGWHRVRLADLPGAEVPLEIASFEVDGAVETICDPLRISSQIPTGGALLQILQDSGAERHGAGAVSQTGDIDRYPLLPRPFHLGAPQSFECGEAYNVFFRQGGRVFQLRVWTAPTGLSPTTLAQIEELIDGLRFELPQLLGVSYGPYLGISCPRANSVDCDGIGLDLVLGKVATRVSASIGDRTFSLATPGLHDVKARGRDWIGYLSRAGLTRKGSSLYIGKEAGAKDWAGDPPVYVPVRVTAAYADGHWATRVFPHIVLRPGFG